MPAIIGQLRAGFPPPTWQADSLSAARRLRPAAGARGSHGFPGHRWPLLQLCFNGAIGWPVGGFRPPSGVRRCVACRQGQAVGPGSLCPSVGLDGEGVRRRGPGSRPTGSSPAACRPRPARSNGLPPGASGDGWVNHLSRRGGVGAHSCHAGHGRVLAAGLIHEARVGSVVPRSDQAQPAGFLHAAAGDRTVGPAKGWVEPRSVVAFRRRCDRGGRGRTRALRNRTLVFLL